MYFVYILRSDKDGELYTGYSTSIQQRVADHNRGHVPATAHRRPLQLIFLECYANKDDAVRREAYLKTTAGKKAIKFMLRTTLEENSSCNYESLRSSPVKVGVDIVLLNKANFVLLVKRSDDHSWSMPGGWVEPHETPDNAIRRELEEETGLSLETMTMEDIVVRDSGSVHITYLAHRSSGMLRNSAESTDIQFMSFETVHLWHADHKERVARVLAQRSKTKI